MANSNDTASSSRLDYGLLLPQIIVGFFDAISFMVVAPSLVFYVLQLGGTKDQYGVILSVFSFASFCFKPALGYWCDKSGYKFRKPYLLSISMASLGGLLYFGASAYHGRTALALIVLGRFCGGIGGANSTLGFTYIAQVMLEDQLTKANAVLSMVRVIGMAVAPASFRLLDGIHGSFFGLEVTPLNAVGLVLFSCNMLSFIVIYFLLEEPPEHTKPQGSVNEADERSWKFWKSIFALDIIVPIFGILSLNANFQLLETGLAPASSDALGWGPVEVSTVFGLNALFIFAVILLTFQLSAAGVSDMSLLIVGLIQSIFGYSIMYLWWGKNSSMVGFVVPVLVSTMAFPFLGAPVRSIFTKAVSSKESLREHQGTMQAIMSMAASIAGFTAPGLIASFVLRSPEEVDASSDQREFTHYALFAPVTSLMVLMGVLYLLFSSTDKKKPSELSADEETAITEISHLLPAQTDCPTPRFHPRIEANRRHSIALMGIPSVDLHSENRNLTRHSLFL